MNTLEFLEEILPNFPEVTGIHVAANVFPLPTPEEFDALIADIGTNGQMQPIMLNHAGLLVDGRSRLMACHVAGKTPAFVKLPKKQDVMKTAIALNMVRRHLTATQKACIAADLMVIYEEAARERMKRGKKAESRATPDDAGNPMTKMSEGDMPSEKGSSRDKAAKAVGASPAYVGNVMVIKEFAPELHKEVLSGKMKLSEAYAIAAERKAPKRAMPPSQRPSAEDMQGAAEMEWKRRLVKIGDWLEEATAAGVPVKTVRDDLLALMKELWGEEWWKVKPGAGHD